jgi:hypothetical protein
MSEIMLVRLTENQMKALEAFIGRVQLNAKEVGAFNDLMNAFQQATPVDEVGEAPTEAVD